MNPSVYAELATLEAEGQPFVVCTVIASQGSTPQKPGAKLVVVHDGTLRGTIGGGAIEQQVVDAAQALLRAPERTSTLETHLTHELGMCCGGRMTVFLEKHDEPAELVLFGAGHVSHALARLAREVGFRVTVVDARPELLTPERFPGATRRLEPPDEVAKTLVGGPHTFICVLTHDHPLDQACVEAVLKTPAAYLGVIGSERKAHKFRNRLRATGFTELEVQRFECPMGVPIEALTPAEIAVSVVARLIDVRRRAKP